MGIKIPIGIENFAKMRERSFYYVDKTLFIRELLEQEFEAYLITRPRRFGKSLTVSMLEDFFDISRCSKAHFEGLEIAKEDRLCQEWMNQWPVVAVTLKDVEGLTYQRAFGMLRVLVSDWCKKYAFLGESEAVEEDDKKIFKSLKSQEADEDNLKSSLALLSRMMTAHYGRQTILLIDEYDVPLAKAYDHGYYEEMLEVIRAMLGRTLKTNPCLKFAILTGCLRISRESVFTGINNLAVNTITMDRFEECVGFTEPEVRELLEAAGLSDHEEEVRDWYDGYRFGGVDIYCPWDVLNYVAALMVNPTAQPDNYWADTSHNEVICKLFENEQFDVNHKFEILLGGGAIRELITENLTYDSLDASEKNLWSLLFMTGYLTLAKEEADGFLPSGETAKYPSTERLVSLRIPNEELRRIFRGSVVEWFQKDVQTMDRTELFQALWNGDCKIAEERISDLLFGTISYHDYRESFYHAFVAGLFAGAGYGVASNYEYGEGRPDVVVKERKKRRALLFEVKHAGKEETLDHACGEALKQIQKKRYAEALEGYRTILSYGIAFKGKDCRIELYRKEV
ncbi:MAG: AAA family ATPase [Eubacteriales bacterium]|nr:AAA family ATPase [Eubacteriales bacterium]